MPFIWATYRNEWSLRKHGGTVIPEERGPGAQKVVQVCVMLYSLSYPLLCNPVAQFFENCLIFFT